MRAVQGASFSVGKGEVFGLLGADGAGKTSIIQILAGVLSADGGEAEVAGLDVGRHPELVKERIGYMPQGIGLNLYDSLSVAENIAFFRDLRRIPEAAYRANRDRLLAATRLAPFLDRLAGHLSGGMRQKLALICTLLHLPDIVLLDEPTTGVDPLSRQDFWAIIQDMVAEHGMTVLLSTAYMDEAERCQRVALLHEGRILASGRPEELAIGLPGQMFRVRGPSPSRIAQALGTAPGIVSAAVFGQSVHVLARDEKDFRQALERAGLGGAVVERMAPDLEDYFIHALGTQAGGGLAPLPPVVSETGLGTKEEAIRTDGLSCLFGTFVAVDRVNLEVRRGEIFGLLGPNGAGKTTLIRMLCGLLPPSRGVGRVGGFDIGRDRLTLRAHIGYMSQRFSLYGDLSVEGNLRLFGGLYGLGGSALRERTEAFVGFLGLRSYLRQPVGRLPLGLRQRLALACALLHGPEILFLDEATSGVDPIMRRQFWSLVAGLAEQGITVLVSTHYMDEAQHCHRLGLMQEGRLIAVGTPEELAGLAKARRGPVLSVTVEDFARAFALLRSRYPQAGLHGRRIRWQSLDPAGDGATVGKLLAEAGLDGSVAVEDPSMEETFASFLEAPHA
ncbi:ATP-binding cassette domain-containing protein [Acidithiobacillus sp. M4-SHS-6]|uniref:ATP-binding cassette domain-containing protein n=1 Tax=Acidithiobacillus sp. M4-SHS-6 TaxID=3383024 RepID=UPI0039BE725D